MIWTFNLANVGVLKIRIVFKIIMGPRRESWSGFLLEPEPDPDPLGVQSSIIILALLEMVSN